MDHTDNGRDPSFERSSLSTVAARNLASTTKTEPQTQGITPRWLLRKLPWVETKGGVYRLNRRLTYNVGDGRVSFYSTGTRVQVIPGSLAELPALRGFEEHETLDQLAAAFTAREVAAGDVIVAMDAPVDEVCLLARGKAERITTGKYGERAVVGVLSDGAHIGDHELVAGVDTWAYEVKAVTRCTVLAAPRSALEALARESEALAATFARFRAGVGGNRDKYGQQVIDVAAGHTGEPALPRTFADYDPAPREYELSVAQAVLRVHTRVVDLFNEPMDQFEQQLRLLIETLRERQEYELINNRDFGLLHNADIKQRIYSATGPPTPDDLDELLCRRRNPKFFLAHPRAIAAFGRQCNRRGVYPQSAVIDGVTVPTWRNVPIFPCNKIPITREGTTSILVLRVGADNQGVVGLHQTGIPDEYQPGLSVRFMNVDRRAIISYLVSLYFSAAVLVPDALGVLEDVQIGLC